MKVSMAHEVIFFCEAFFICHGIDLMLSWFFAFGMRKAAGLRKSESGGRIHATLNPFGRKPSRENSVGRAYMTGPKRT